jgi:hypothetical protein
MFFYKWQLGLIFEVPSLLGHLSFSTMHSAHACIVNMFFFSFETHELLMFFSWISIILESLLTCGFVGQQGVHPCSVE